MKPIEISKQEFYAIKKALRKKARELSRAQALNFEESEFEDEPEGDPELFLSDRTLPCFFSGFNTPKHFKWIYHFDMDIIHFLNFPCNCDKVRKKLSPIDWPICLTKKKTKYKMHYYLAVHNIGNCPWKEA